MFYNHHTYQSKNEKLNYWGTHNFSFLFSWLKWHMIKVILCGINATMKYNFVELVHAKFKTCSLCLYS